MTNKKYTHLTEKDDSLYDKLISPLLTEEDREFDRLVKGLILAAKEDIKNKKSSKNASPDGLRKFIDELATEYKDKTGKNKLHNPYERLFQGSQEDELFKALKPHYDDLKKHLAEYAISGINNSSGEIVYKSLKNCFTAIVDVFRTFVGNPIHSKHENDKLEARSVMKYRGQNELVINPDMSFAKKVVKMRVESKNASKNRK